MSFKPLYPSLPLFVSFRFLGGPKLRNYVSFASRFGDPDNDEAKEL